MAGLHREANGRYRVSFYGPDRRRLTVRLGKVAKRQAEATRTRIEYLVAAKASRQPIDADTARWVAEIDDELADRLARAGLIEPRKPPETATLREFCDRHLDAQSGPVTGIEGRPPPRTRRPYRILRGDSRHAVRHARRR